MSDSIPDLFLAPTGIDADAFEDDEFDDDSWMHHVDDDDEYVVDDVDVDVEEDRARER